jgi:hypothetical protein
MEAPYKWKSLRSGSRSWTEQEVMLCTDAVVAGFPENLLKYISTGRAGDIVIMDPKAQAAKSQDVLKNFRLLHPLLKFIRHSIPPTYFLGDVMFEVDRRLGTVSVKDKRAGALNQARLIKLMLSHIRHLRRNASDASHDDSLQQLKDLLVGAFCSHTGGW